MLNEQQMKDILSSPEKIKGVAADLRNEAARIEARAETLKGSTKQSNCTFVECVVCLPCP